MSEFAPRRVYSMEELRSGDIVRATTEAAPGIETVTSFTYGKWDPTYLQDVTLEGSRILNLPFEDGVVEIIGRKEKEWPEGGTPILVTETHDPLGEAGLPKPPFVAIVTGRHFTASRDGSWIHDWNKSFVTKWRELEILDDLLDDYAVEVKSE